MSIGAHRYPSNAVAVPTKQIMEADALLTHKQRRKEAWRMAWALIEAKAKAGDQDAIALALYVDSGGAA